MERIQRFLLLTWKKEEMLAKIFQKSKFCLCFYYSMLPSLSSWHLFVSLIVSFRYACSTTKVFLQQTCTLAFIVSTFPANGKYYRCDLPSINRLTNFHVASTTAPPSFTVLFRNSASRAFPSQNSRGTLMGLEGEFSRFLESTPPIIEQLSSLRS